MLDITLEPLYDHQYQQNVQFMPLHLPWTLHCKNNRLVRKDYRSWFPSLISSSEKFTRNLNGNGKNSTNINETHNHISHQTIEHIEKTTTYHVENPSHCFGQEHKYGGLKPGHGFPTFLHLIFGCLTRMPI
jgi:hypothetical protein